MDDRELDALVERHVFGRIVKWWSIHPIPYDFEHPIPYDFDPGGVVGMDWQPGKGGIDPDYEYLLPNSDGAMPSLEWTDSEDGDSFWAPVPRRSTNIAAAKETTDKLIADGWHFSCYYENDYQWHAVFWREEDRRGTMVVASAETEEKARVLAALKAVGVEVDDE